MKRLLLHTVFFVVEVAAGALSVSPTSEPPLPTSTFAGSADLLSPSTEVAAGALSVSPTSEPPLPTSTFVGSGELLFPSNVALSLSRTVGDSAVLTTMVSATQLPSPTVSPTPGLTPVYEDPVVTYGDNQCEKYVAGGHCEAILSVFPAIVSNYSREHNQYFARGIADQFVDALVSFNASEICLQLAIPLVCRWTIPTCDPAFVVPTYQPLCRYDCEIIRDFVCKQPWERMLELLHLLNAPDQPDCSPLNNTEAGNAPMCVGSIRTGAVPLPQRTGSSCYSGTGRGYNGSVSVTSSGIPCQPWNSSYPHQHLLYLEGFEELEGGHNYCRNPGNRGDRPWCFTTDRGVRWEYCNVPRCDNGTVCEPYSLQVEHGLCRTTATIGMDLLFINTSIADQVQYDDKMVDIQLAIAEYSEECRNMFFEYVCVSNFPQCDPSYSSPRPTLPCRRFCRDIASRCTEDIRAFRALGGLVSYSPLQIEFNCDNLPEASGGEAPECYLPVSLPALVGNETCYEPSNKGLDYIGRVSVTESGHTCQSWTAQMPHPHTMTPVLRPYLDKHNYCRNPEGRGTKPWCYTTDPQVRWEYCDIPVCGFIAVTPDYEQPEEEITNIPTWAIIVIAAVCVLLLLIAVLVFCIFFIRKMSKEQKAPVAYCDPRYTEGPVRFVGKKEMLEEEEKTATSNPLYTRNSQLHPEQSLEYEGVKLPEYPRSNIIYVRDLGQGHFGVVVQAEARNIEEGREVSVVAIKVLKEGATPQIKKEFFREASLMCAFDHPNILKLLGVCIEMEPLCMIFEYMELGDLNNFLRKKSPNNWGSSTSLTHSGHMKPGLPGLTTQQLVFISVDVATGLEYLAQNHYVHRDLATRNCLVSGELRVKISDFGLSQDIYSKDYFRLGDSELLPIRWMPPEAILYAKFTTQSDVWSFGIVLWEIFSFGMQPYFSLTNEEVVAHVRDGNVLNCPDRCPQEIYDLMLDCWAMNPSERPTAAEINMGLRRWTPDLSASLQMQTHVQPDYQNMAVVREYATTQLSCHSTSGRTLNDSKCSMGGGKFEMAPANNARPDAIGHDHSFVATTPPPEESWVPTVAYSSCSGEDSAHVVGGSTHVVDDQQETTVL